jgi:hypothetical protein
MQSVTVKRTRGMMVVWFHILKEEIYTMIVNGMGKINGGGFGNEIPKFIQWYRRV